MKSISLRRQRGATLIVGLVMLILMTLFAITTFKLSKGNLQIVGGMQQRNEAQAAAQEAIEKVVSSATFSVTPTNAIPNTSCGTTPIANKLCVDTRGDGVKVGVVVNPSCVSTRVIPNSELDFTRVEGQLCLLSAGTSTGIEGSVTNNSLCASMLWNINAVATDANTSAQFTIDQGESVRVASTKRCP